MTDWRTHSLVQFYRDSPDAGKWHQLKSHEICGQMFDNEYDLAKAVMAGMDSRSVAGEYALDRFIFNCA